MLPIKQRLSLTHQVALCCGCLLLLSAYGAEMPGQFPHAVRMVEVAPGWARNSVNAPIFRKDSITSDAHWQFIAFYDANANVVIARRKVGDDAWQTHITPFKGNVNDAHNSISILLDGDGYLHLSWDHHDHPLRYTRSLEPWRLEFPATNPTMIGTNEDQVGYPEFYAFNNGDLLFAYRDGGSGNGNLVLNRYHCDTQRWERVQTLLIDGEGQRNAYWQLCIDGNDSIHLSWVWRDNPDVASNHDLHYACSHDGGHSWQRSDGVPYALPIRFGNAERIHPIPQGSNLINQTSMATDRKGQAYIATYYRSTSDAVTQFQLIYRDGDAWKHSTATLRNLDFELQGIGSRSIPISRPLLLVKEHSNGTTDLLILYRDEEFGNAICLSHASLPSLQWRTRILHSQNMGRWEPSCDSNRWRMARVLHLYVQTVGQGQAETLENLDAQMVSILEWTP
jgi:hypothetical protein